MDPIAIAEDHPYFHLARQLRNGEAAAVICLTDTLIELLDSDRLEDILVRALERVLDTEATPKKKISPQEVYDHILQTFPSDITNSIRVGEDANGKLLIVLLPGAHYLKESMLLLIKWYGQEWGLTPKSVTITLEQEDYTEPEGSQFVKQRLR